MPWGTAPTDRHRLSLKAREVVNLISEKFQHAEASYVFLGARELVDLAQRQPVVRRQLKLTNVLVAGDDAYVGLIALSDFNDLVSESASLRADVFDANVRDYEGNVEVNRGIRESLTGPPSEADFWWLNNGVTILATQASLAGHTLTLENAQVVNGFQTSKEISNHVAGLATRDERRVLAKILITESEDLRDRIIRATNSQTSVGAFSLRATDPLHRDLEDFLRPRGLYYERRKNHYKNRGRPRDQIVTIRDVAQAVVATILFEPDNARARPSSLIKRDADYGRVFNPDFPLAAFETAVRTVRHADRYLKDQGLSAVARNNYRFHLAMVAGAMLGARPNSPATVAAVSVDDLTNAFPEALAVVRAELDALVTGDTTLDSIAKSPRSRTALITRLNLPS